MIARVWRGEATAGKAQAYRRHVETTVFPTLKTIPGHRGALLLQRDLASGVEFLAVTFWETRDAIRAFTGDALETAVVEPAARAVLSQFDEVARHYDVACDSWRKSLG